MADLVAQGTSSHQRWRRRLVPGQVVRVGRCPELSDWATPWDAQISRSHIVVQWVNRRLEVSRDKNATNPIFFHGSSQKNFGVRPGEHFVIGETTFTVTDDLAQISIDCRMPVSERTFSADYLRSRPFRHAEKQIEALSRLPDLVGSASSEHEMFVQLVSVLISGIPKASAAAIVRCADTSIEILHWDRSSPLPHPFQPSERLIQEASEMRQNIVHTWNDDQLASQQPSAVNGYTQTGNTMWAFCCPLQSAACPGWAIYVAGESLPNSPSRSHRIDQDDLQDDLKFAEIVGTAVGNISEVRLLQRRETSLSHFFSPLVMQAVRRESTDVLEPRETEVSVLFCDLRGFSRKSEQLADNLLSLLNRVSESLGIVTHHILQQGGVIGDFHGDASMGFWGWPIDQCDMQSRACRAALDIRSAFANLSQYDDEDFGDFKIGLGIATGRAVAGRIGTRDQVKVTAFGPVVNVASRLEGLNKVFGSEILVDRETIDGLTEVDKQNFRRIGIVRPYGMELTQVELFQLLPEDKQLSEQYSATFHRAVDNFIDGNWEKAADLLRLLKGEDAPRDFLLSVIDRASGVCPKSWDGAIAFGAK
ncbi:MAG: adenylate/guanylate cyclase domain-containing protein [Planctomycetales bacterium]|nr:adenylate/guanylate cyclase domain-containing protein [Planctomycetales bacterium]